MVPPVDALAALSARIAAEALAALRDARRASREPGPASLIERDARAIELGG